MKITVFNVGRGAAVLVELPPRDGVPAPVGVVDCFSGVGGEAPLLKRLEDIDHASAGHLSIEFLVLTHMHSDHFFGAADLIRRYRTRIKKYYDPGIDPRAVMSADFRTTALYDHHGQQELLEIDRFKEKNKRRVYSLTSPGMPIYSDSSNSVTVTSVAPEGLMLNGVKKSLNRYIGKLREAINRNEDLPEPDRSYDLNRTSSAIEIRFREISLILGGDVLTPTWNILVAKRLGAEVDLVLLSHHGASNAFPKNQWKKLLKPDGYAIISGKGKGQPGSDVLKHLKGSTGAVWATNIPSEHRVDPVLSYVSALHYGAEITANIKEGDVVCEMSRGLKVAGPRIF